MVVGLRCAEAAWSIKSTAHLVRIVTVGPDVGRPGNDDPNAVTAEHERRISVETNAVDVAVMGARSTAENSDKPAPMGLVHRKPFLGALTFPAS